MDDVEEEEDDDEDPLEVPVLSMTPRRLLGAGALIRSTLAEIARIPLMRVCSDSEIVLSTVAS